jgi:hypothetical protein
VEARDFVAIEKTIEAEAKLTDFRSKHLEARHRYVIAPVYLEKVTADGIRSWWDQIVESEPKAAV